MGFLVSRPECSCITLATSEARVLGIRVPAGLNSALLFLSVAGYILGSVNREPTDGLENG